MELIYDKYIDVRIKKKFDYELWSLRRCSYTLYTTRDEK